MKLTQEERGRLEGIADVLSGYEGRPDEWLLALVSRLETPAAVNVGPGIVWSANGDAGDSTGRCEICGEERDEPHTWEECARASAAHDLATVNRMVDVQIAAETAERERDEARAWGEAEHNERAAWAKACDEARAETRRIVALVRGALADTCAFLGPIVAYQRFVDDPPHHAACRMVLERAAEAINALPPPEHCGGPACARCLPCQCRCDACKKQRGILTPGESIESLARDLADAIRATYAAASTGHPIDPALPDLATLIARADAELGPKGDGG